MEIRWCTPHLSLFVNPPLLSKERHMFLLANIKKTQLFELPVTLNKTPQKDRNLFFVLHTALS